jgi:hypothetical protein
MPLNNDFRLMWEAAGYGKPHGYFTDMASASAVKPPGPEFKRVYHLTSAEYAISNLALGRIKLSRFTDLNDPFELLPLTGQLSPTVREIVDEFTEMFNREYGLLCFSGNWSNPVLWSHYGASHYGMCIGFDVPIAMISPIGYVAERILPPSIEIVFRKEHGISIRLAHRSESPR